MRSGRFVPLNLQVGGYIKTFFWIWVILFIILFVALGISYWAFFGALGISIILSIPIYYMLVILTGVKGGLS